MQRNAQHALAGIGNGAGFRLYLQAELARRCAANAQYSLRSFARHLGVHHSTLSQLIRGRRGLSGAMIARLGERLGLSDAEIERFTALEGDAGSEQAGPGRGIRRLARDAAAILADPDHRAVLELMDMEEFRPDSRWIARVLNRTTDEVNVLITRLLHLGVIELAAQDRWISCLPEGERTGGGFERFIAAGLAGRVRMLAAGQETKEQEWAATLSLHHHELAPLFALLGDAAPHPEEIGSGEQRFRVQISITQLTDTHTT